MKKTAQTNDATRGLWNRIREMGSVTPAAAKKHFGPQIEQIIKSLVQKDDQIRSIVSGTVFGKSQNPNAPSLKNLLKEAKTQLNRREYLTSLHDLTLFITQVSKVVQEIDSIEKMTTGTIHGKNLDSPLLTREKKQRLFDIDQNIEKMMAMHSKAGLEHAAFIKEANALMDFFHGMGTRGRALAAWEKIFPRDVNKLKDGIDSLLSKFQGLLEIILSSLKEMATARADRNFDAYNEAGGVIKKSFLSSLALFKGIHDGTLKEAIRRLKNFEEQSYTASPQVSAPGNSNAGGTAVPAASNTTSPVESPASTSFGPITERTGPTEMNVPVEELASNTVKDPGTANALPIKKLPEIEEAAPDTIRSPNTATLAPVKTHKAFYESLVSMSGENPLILASFITKYARVIQSTDIETSVKLFKIAKSIRG